ncbi:HAMP domain-containing histidine kinase [candidate division KSB1 bacterium]|nr:HAMP domain-containing histidine kinase [candidate division KSB1 bacterium]
MSANQYDSVIVSYDPGFKDYDNVLKSIGDVQKLFLVHPDDEKNFLERFTADYHYILKDTARNYIKDLPLLVQKNKLESSAFSYEEMFNVILEKILIGIIIIDSDRSIKFMNEKISIIFGISENAANLSLESLLKQCKDNGQILLDTLDEAGVSSIELEVQHPFERIIKVTISPLRNEYNSSTDNLLLFYDITPEKELDRMKSDFVSSVSHEMRTPLAAVLGFSDTILRDTQMDEDIKKEFIQIIYEESKRLSDLIEDILNISNVESFQRYNKLKKISIETIVESVIQLLKPQALRKQLLLTAEIEQGLPKIIGDEQAIEQIAMQLIENAIKFTEADGAVKITLFQDENAIILEVCDTGLGIPEKDREKIFKKFFRVHRPHREIQGTGLGLYIVKQIVDFYKGKIEVTDNNGNGSIFRIHFPVISVIEENEDLKIVSEVSQ